MNNYSGLDLRTKLVASMNLLKTSQPYEQSMQFANQEDLPLNKSDTIVWRRYNNFPVDLTPLTEGGTKAFVDLTFSDIQATLLQYGDVSALTDKTELMAEDPIMKVIMEKFGKQKGQVLESLNYNVLKASTNVFLEGGVSAVSDIETALSLDTLRTVETVMLNNNCEKITEIVTASVGFNTTPVEAAYFVLVNPKVIKVLRGMDGFLVPSKYPSMKALPGELGAVESFRFLQSSLYIPDIGAGKIPTDTTIETGTGGKTNVYNSIVLAKDGFTVAKLKGHDSVEINVSSSSATIGGNEFANKRSISWKLYYAVAITNPLNVAVIKHGIKK